MKNILSQEKIIPNNGGYPVQEIFDSVRSVLNKSAIIQCVVDRTTKMSLISEIRICFNKMLDLTDCDTVKEGDFIRIADILTNCNIKKPVMYYPDNVTAPVPIAISDDEEDSVLMTIPRTTATMSTLDSLYNTREYLITFYRTIKLLIWATI
ncbi:hypothetical protein ILUMI_25758 [Ignelater luminosus]|uniref:Uncharacterized protein n=1 Tax=Ignelater luminosus TaxID=2038154 RepID=A0A8K0FZR7_IGNLU|nr:hypothetical protein ILUMI_25758 [Ignelater luminosus]